jgi:aminopeptidase N
VHKLIGVGAAVLALVLAAPAAAQQFSAGSSGLDDPFFPFAGNGGYDVKHYSLGLDYDPATDVLVGDAKIVAVAKQNLSRFNLDLRGFAISDLEVNRSNAQFARDGQELIVTPRRGLRRGHPFVVEVSYEGVPAVIIDPDGSSEGWVHTDDGAFVVNEPQGSPGWYPANDNPRDKATYDFRITVPEGKTALGNGVLVNKRTRRGKTTWTWLSLTPMAPYLATATNGDFRFWRDRGPHGLPIYNAVAPEFGTEPDAVLAKQPEIISFFSDLVGRYPAEAAGAIVDTGDVGYALETQTKPNYDGVPDESTVVHEISHEWFGNSISLTIWPDIWLNEGFAAFAEWIYAERHGGTTAAAVLDTECARAATSSFWRLPPGNPGTPARLFAGQVYTRGGMTLQKLRETVGDAAFFRILRRWYAENRRGNVVTADFIELSERISGRELSSFFDTWLYQPVKPADC